MAKTTYFIPVAFEMYGYLPIQAESVEEAFEYAETNIDALKLPSDASYVEGSFEIDHAGLVRDISGAIVD